MSDRQTPLSMIRSYTWADLLTLGHASCGTSSIFACLSYIAGDQSGWLWTVFASQLGAGVAISVPLASILVVAAVMLVAANVVVIGPAWMACRRSPGAVLRTD